MVLDTEKQVDECISTLLKECAKSDEDGLGGVLKVVRVLAEFMDMDNTMEVLNSLLYHDNEKIALNSLAIFRHLRDTGDIDLQPIALSRREDGEEFVEPIDEEEVLSEDETLFDEIAIIPEIGEMDEEVGGFEVSEDDVTLEIEDDESMVEDISELDISSQPKDFELQVPEISTFIPIEKTVEEDVEETIEEDVGEEISPFGDAEPESPFENIKEPIPFGEVASPFDNMGDDAALQFGEGFEPEPEEIDGEIPTISAIDGESKTQWEDTVDKIARLKDKYINK